MILQFAWPPSKNAYKGTDWKRRHKYLKAAARDFIADVMVEWLRVNDGRKPKPMTGDIRLDICAYPPDSRRRDIANIEEILQDAMTRAGVYVDDYQISEKRIRRMPVEPGGMVIVEVEEVKS